MAGYNGRLGNEGDTLFQNATAINSQALEQRTRVQESNTAKTRSINLGVGSNSSRLFDFDGSAIMRDARTKFLSEVEASSNPDFTSKFDPTSMKNFETIIDEAIADSDINDSPSFGLGPNMKAQDIDNVISGNIVSEENIRPELPGNRGFGWKSNSHKSETIGDYFNKKYSFADQDEDGRGSEDAIKGERIDTDSISYTQTYQ